METCTYLLFSLGLIGGADIVLFHSVAHGVRSHGDSWRELVAHSLRGPIYAALFVLIPNFEMRGLFAWGLMVLFALDVGISVWDFSLERTSRRFLGGLPSGEYVLHMVMAMVFGGLVASVLYCARDWLGAATRLTYAPAAVPKTIRIAMAMMAVLVFASGVQDAWAAFRLRRRARWEEVRSGARAASGDYPTHPSRLISRVGDQSLDAQQTQRPGWMRPVLAVAGIYNLGWGTWVVLFPSAVFRLTGMAPINYPQIWQCVGMIVGVYGIGYLIAATHPLRHWPIVLVGLLGKVLGPVGMVWAIASGSLPSGLLWLCVTNDLIWCPPFALILCRALACRVSAASNGTSTSLDPYSTLT